LWREGVRFFDRRRIAVFGIVLLVVRAERVSASVTGRMSAIEQKM